MINSKLLNKLQNKSKYLILILFLTSSNSYSFIFNLINDLNKFNQRNRSAIKKSYQENLNNITKRNPNSKNNSKDYKDNEKPFNKLAGKLPVEVEEIVEFINNPQKFTRLGINRPKGILLVGPPGTGKTSIARQIAASAKAEFISANGASFVNIYVGNGPRRVRKLFKQAKKVNGPVIIFIDEIDAIAGKRSELGGGSNEYNNTLNELLGKMDGFEQDENITVIGATNFPQHLDEAILRPGRFDRKIYIGLPDQESRKQILEFYCSKISCDLQNIDFDKLSKSTKGLSGADLKNLINESAIRASRKNKTVVEQNDIELALEEIH